MSAPPTSASDRPADAEQDAARRAGWRRSDLTWERLQEQASNALAAGERERAAVLLRRAHRIAFWRFRRGDPRYASSLANLALADRLAGREARARRRYARALRLWHRVPAWIDGMQCARRARSSLFHMRLEGLHWDTYEANLRRRMRRFADEAEEAIAALAEGRPSPHRLVERWRGEKPALFDDTRKLLAAALLIAQSTDDAVARGPLNRDERG